MSKFAALAQAKVPEGEDQGDIPDDAVIPAVAAVASEAVSTAPATSKFGAIRSPAAVAAASMDDPNNNWDDVAESVPAPDAAAGAAGSEKPTAGIEGAVLEALRNRSGTTAAGVAADMPASPAEGATSFGDATTADIGDAVAAEAPATDAGVAGLSPEEIEARFGALLGDDNDLREMLSVAYGDEDAMRIANEYTAHRRQGLERLRLLAMSEEEQRRQLEALHEESKNSAVGGGPMTSLLNKMFGGNVDPATKEIKAIGRDRVKALQEYSGARENMRNRLSSSLRAGLAREILDLQKGGEDIGHAVNRYNSVFLGTEAAAPLLDAAKQYAAETGMPLDQVAAAIGDGKVPEALQTIARQVSGDVLATDEVKQASAALREQEAAFEDRLKTIAKKMGVLTKNGESLPAENHQRLIKILDEIAEKTPAPISEEEGKKMRERFREMVESIRQAIQNLFASIFPGAKAG